MTSRHTIAKEYKNLGVANGWKELPPELKACRDKGHVPRTVSSTLWRCYTYYYCDECKILYEVDSSD